ncbi:MAG: hypothetical protein ACE5F9_04840 [Phycisphaerae bacterium]
MRTLRCLGCMLAMLLPALVGCSEPDPQMQANAPPQGYAPKHPRNTEYFVFHNDQGMMADRCISDIHFIPHTAELSGVGVARLGRYAELLAGSGGTIYYDTDITDEGFVEARLKTATDFLAGEIPGTQPISVALGMPGGPGIGSAEATKGATVAQQPEPRATAYRLDD